MSKTDQTRDALLEGIRTAAGKLGAFQASTQAEILGKLALAYHHVTSTPGEAGDPQPAPRSARA